MKDIKIVYVDDDIETLLSKFLETKYGDNFIEYTFDCQKGYEDLLQAEQIRTANVIIIDSKLFNDSHVHDKKFRGEEFRLILKKEFPFVEVIVITHNEVDDKQQIVSKYKKSNTCTAEEYYKDNLIPLIERAIENVEAYRIIAEKLSHNTEIDKIIIDRIKNSLDGLNEYDSLKSKDVDALIGAFEELLSKINE